MNNLNEKKHKEVIAVLVIGKKWTDIFNKTYRKCFEDYARKINAELVIIDDYIKKSDKRAPWQKLLIFDHPKISKYDRAMFLDADIYITKHARNPFESLQNKPWGVVDNNPYNLESLKKTDPQLYNHCPTHNRPEKMINSGVFIISKEYKSMLDMIYEKYPEQQCCDNGPLSYHLLNDGKGVLLPEEFNTIFCCYRFAFGLGLSKVLKMYHENSFIHFAGNKGIMLLPLIKYIDTHEKTILKKIIYFLGKEKFDLLTAFVINIVGKIYASYSYHLKRNISKLF